MNTEIPWQTAKQYEDITYKKCNGVARISIKPPEVIKAVRPRKKTEKILGIITPWDLLDM